MARIRTVKPEFWTNEKLSECSLSARLLFIGSWNFADDNGNLPRSAKRLKMQVLPADSIDCEPLICELIAHGLLTEYSVNGEKYLNIKGFKKHQLINRPSKCVIPTLDKADKSCESVTTHGVFTDGREGKGGEGEEDKSSLRSDSSSAGEDKPPAVSDQRSIASLETAKQVRERRLAEVTHDAVDAYNEAPFTKAKGGACPNVTLVNEVRQKEVNRCLKVASQICQRMYGSPKVIREFWADYWATVNEDEHASGRLGGGRDHQTWVPDFEYLTNPKVMTKLFDRAMSQEASHG